MEVLDTNVIVRYLTEDDADHSQRAHAAFLAIASGAREVYLSEAVIVETVQVLESRRLYGLSRNEVATHLRRLLGYPGVHVPARRVSHRAIDLFEATGAVSFVDCLCVAHAERLGGVPVLSFDRGFDRASLRAETAVRRLEPS
jgi:predicted nucleic-acid-binding protein